MVQASDGVIVAAARMFTTAHASAITPDDAAQARAIRPPDTLAERLRPRSAINRSRRTLDMLASRTERLASPCSEAENGSSAPAWPVELLPMAVRPKKRRRPYRKPTYYKRKEETKALQAQLELLQAQLECLKTENQLLASASTQEEQHRQSAAFRARRSLLRSRVENDVLRETVQTQQLAIARAHSAVSNHVIAHSGALPFASTIRLGRDWDERHATLLAMKDQKIRAAHRYIAERSRHLDPFVRYNDTARFVNASGDYCSLLFDILPLEGDDVSVRQAYDALLFYFFNMEISITELQGDLMLRESDESSAIPLHFYQSRLVSGERSDGVRIETNALEFCQLYEADSAEAAEWGGGREFGVVVGDFVDEDELFPYSPSSRVRHDVTGTIVVMLEPRKKVRGSSDGGGSQRGDEEEEEELVVVLKRVGFLTVRATELPVSPGGMEELRRSVEGWGDAMLKTVEEIVYRQRDARGALAAVV